jgi:hypothetical protein
MYIVAWTVTISVWKRCSVRLYLQLFVGGLVFYLCYLCLLALFTLVSNTYCVVFFLHRLNPRCCQFVWIVHLWHHYTQASTNNINKTRALPQTTIINNILTPGIMTRSTSRKMSSHDSPSCGAVSGTRVRMYPGETFGKTQQFMPRYT